MPLDGLLKGLLFRFHLLDIVLTEESDPSLCGGSDFFNILHLGGCEELDLIRISSAPICCLADGFHDPMRILSNSIHNFHRFNASLESHNTNFDVIHSARLNSHGRFVKLSIKS